MTGLATGPRSPAPLRPGELTIESLPDEGGVTVVLRGELDLASAGALERALHAAQAGPERLVVDLSGLTFIDSTGIHVLLQAQQRTNGRLSLRRGPDEVQRVLELTRVADYFAFEDGSARDGKGSARDGKGSARDGKGSARDGKGSQSSPAQSPQAAMSDRPAASPSG